MEKGNFYSIKIKHWKEKKTGILIDESESWILIHKILNDYMLDGYELLNKKYISSINRDQNEIFIENVLMASNKINMNYISLPLETMEILDYLNKQQLIFELSTNFEDSIYIGKIHKILQKSIYIEPLDTNGEWLKEDYLFRINSLRRIALGSDYLNSLIKYNESICVD